MAGAWTPKAAFSKEEKTLDAVVRNLEMSGILRFLTFTWL